VTVADRFDVYRGDLADLTGADDDSLPDGGHGRCVSESDADPTVTVFVDAEQPSAGQTGSSISSRSRTASRTADADGVAPARIAIPLPRARELVTSSYSADSGDVDSRG
jgi:hypothetical protein